MQTDPSAGVMAGDGAAFGVVYMLPSAASLVPPVLALTTEFEFDHPESPEAVFAVALPEDPLFALPEKAEKILPRLDGDVQKRQGFQLGELSVMIGYLDGSELTEIPDVYYLPNVPTWFLGMANLHGNTVPVFDLVAYLGLQPRSEAVQKGTGRRMLLVLGHGADAVGIVIEDLPRRLSWLPNQEMNSDTAPLALQPHVRAAVLIDGALWFDLDCESLFNALEKSMEQLQ